MLRVTFIGNLGADPELRYTAKGTQVLSFNVAVNQVRFGPNGERQENTEWFRVRVTGRQVDFVQQRVGKGARVLVIGRMDITHFQGKDGEPRTGYDVWADDVQVMSSQRPMGAGMGTEQDGLEAEAGEAHEPGLAAAGANANGNGNARARGGGRGASTSRASNEELEDLPF
jgi:single-strand DNA-binding protein